MVRRYIHGTNRIDERAVMLAGTAHYYDPVDSYYYVLQELDTVTGLITSNGALAEAYTYDAYGKVSMWSYHPADFDRNGLVTIDDNGEWNDAFPSSPADDPQADGDTDGDVDYPADYLAVFDPSAPGFAQIHTSGVGNPFFFTGRRLHFVETLDSADPSLAEENRQVQYNRARHYAPGQGRWLQRDPVGYSGGGMSVYEYAHANPAFYVDVNGEEPEPPNQDWTDKWGISVPGEFSGKWAGQPVINRDGCGDFAFNFEFYLWNPSGSRKDRTWGHIVQEVTLEQEQYDCSCSKQTSNDPADTALRDWHYWEVWVVPKGHRHKSKTGYRVAVDNNNRDRSKKKTYGKFKGTYVARFFPSYKLEDDWRILQNHPAGILGTKDSSPQGWEGSSGGEPHSIEIFWNCCDCSCPDAPVPPDTETTQWGTLSPAT